MRLLVINWQDRLNPLAGGAEAHLHEIFGRLSGRGHRVSMLVSGWKGAASRTTVDGLDVHRAGSRHTFSVAAPAYYRTHLATEPFDLVVEALNKVPLFSPLWTGKPGALIVHHLFGTAAFQEASLPVAGLTWLLERPLGRIYRGVPVQAISRSTADDLVERGLREKDIRVIHPGVDLRFFTPGASEERFTAPTFLYLGRLRRYKGVELILSALAVLRSEGVHARLIVAGTGDWSPRLRACAHRLGLAGAVEFPGFVDEDTKRDLFRRSWANVFPSPKEGWGITNLEAAACGTATVASDSPGLRESVVAGETGLLVPHGDVPALAAALRRLALERDEVERLGAGAREFARSFTWDSAADQTEAHLRELVELGARRSSPFGLS